MRSYEEMKITYIDPDQRALYVGELPDGGFGVWAQAGKAAPRKLYSKGYIKPEGYATPEEAQHALGIYVSQKRDGQAWARWEVFVNGKRATFDEHDAMCRGDMPVPDAAPPAAIVTLANLEYRIATHMQGACENLLEVGHCLIEAKDSGLVAHGEWEAWVRRNTCMSERSAQKLMQAARCVLPGSVMERLPISKIQAILALPEPERETMAEKADSEDMSLRELQEAVKREKERADQLAEINVKTNARAAASASAAQKAKAMAEGYKLAQQKSEVRIAEAERVAREEAERRADEEIEALRQKLATKEQAAPAAGISAEAQAEIDRLKADLADAERYAEQQAEQRQQAQRDMLAMQSQAARGEIQGNTEGLSASDLAAAVRTFIGSAGVLPHMGAAFCRMREGERQQMTQYVDMMAAWVEDARQALGTIMVTE
ncbi:MAG: DUF3102 domain-containing protein [Comamonas sp.]|uniref:DUF3102 domain-containing protein n=1 Tax=Comamonas sp. TaxID=34028 RepID=UPI002FC58829